MTDALRDRALNLLSYRPHSKKELYDKLVRKGVSPPDALEAVDWLSEYGFLDDHVYACSVARHYARKGYGPQRIRAELHRRGISREYWEEALSEIPDMTEKIDRYISCRLTDSATRQDRQKVMASLGRRGFSHSEIRDAFYRITKENIDTDWTE